MQYIKNNLKSILIIALIFVGLIVSLILIKNPTIFKSKAAADIDYPSALNITDSSSQPLNYKGEGVYIIKDSKIKLGIKDFQKLVENKQLNLDQTLQIWHFDPDYQKYNTFPYPKVTYCYSPIGSPENCQQEDSQEDNTDNYKAKNLPPTSTIPTTCQSIGPSPLMTIPQPPPLWINWVAENAGDPDLLNATETGQPAQFGGTVVQHWIMRNLLGMMGYASFWLPFKWDQSGSIPKTQGDEDPRWVLRTIRMIGALQNDQSNYFTNAVKYWNKKEGYDLDKACKEVLRLKEDKLLQGVWLPSDDKLEEIGKGILGQ